jgi:hypothetical protein
MRAFQPVRVIVLKAAHAKSQSGKVAKENKETL